MNEVRKWRIDWLDVLITLKLYYVQLFQRNGAGSCRPCQNDLL